MSKVWSWIGPLYSSIPDRDFQSLFVGWTAPLVCALALLFVEQIVWKIRGRRGDY
jgi:hypothetical protein